MASERTRVRQNLVAAKNAARRGQERLLSVITTLEDIRPDYTKNIEQVMTQFCIAEECMDALIENQP
jgi:hypothetical protein